MDSSTTRPSAVAHIRGGNNATRILGEVKERTVVIHSGPDDFTSQPSGNAGQKIACGIIRKA